MLIRLLLVLFSFLFLYSTKALKASHLFFNNLISRYLILKSKKVIMYLYLSYVIGVIGPHKSLAIFSYKSKTLLLVILFILFVNLLLRQISHSRICLFIFEFDIILL